MVQKKAVMCLVTFIGLIVMVQKIESAAAIDNEKINFTALVESYIVNFKDDTSRIDRLEKDRYADVDFMGESISNTQKWKSAAIYLKSIGIVYENFTKKLQSADYNWKQWSQDMLIQNGTVQKALKGILESVNDGLLEDAKNESVKCHFQQSENQMITNIFRTIDLSYLKGYVMTQFALSYVKEAKLSVSNTDVLNAEFQNRLKIVLEKTKQVLAKAKKDIWKCDPQHYVKDDTYLEVTKLLQGIILNERDIKDNFCEDTCSDFNFIDGNGYTCQDNSFCKRQKPRPCNGEIFNCKHLSDKMKVCESESPEKKLAYVDHKMGRRKQKETCASRHIHYLESWNRLFFKCTYCFCICDEENKSDRFVNMRQALSDVKRNKVVTGLKFAKANRIFHLQIQEGLLLANEAIDQNSLAWVDVENYTLYEKGYYENGDYFKLTYHRRAVDLDDVNVPVSTNPNRNFVLTGVRFKRLGDHLNFEIHATLYDRNTGLLIPNSGHWVSNDNTPTTGRKEQYLGDVRVPTESPKKSAMTSKSNTFLKFTHTSIDHDAAQTTVPFLDAQPVTPQIATPLCGAGIYHKGRLGYGGFLAPKIMTCDLNKQLKSSLPV